jgi:hypothetical protein
MANLLHPALTYNRFTSEPGVIAHYWHPVWGVTKERQRKAKTLIGAFWG